MNPCDPNSGMFVEDLLSSADFVARPVRERLGQDQVATLQRLTRVLTESPEDVLQELAEAALDLCHADSAGVSMEVLDENHEFASQWVAITGTYERFRGAVIPQRFMPCKVCLGEQRPQLIRIMSSHFKQNLDIDAEPVTDGMLLPWDSDGQRATIWVVAHGRTHAFDRTDYDILRVFANFAATTYRASQQRRRGLRDAEERGASAMANTLAHRINNPLQSVTNAVYLMETSETAGSKETRQLADEVNRLSSLVQELLTTFHRGSIQ